MNILVINMMLIIMIIIMIVTMKINKHIRLIRGSQRDPNPKDESLISKETSTYEGFHSMFAAIFSH